MQRILLGVCVVLVGCTYGGREVNFGEYYFSGKFGVLVDCEDGYRCGEFDFYIYDGMGYLKPSNDNMMGYYSIEPLPQGEHNLVTNNGVPISFSYDSGKIYNLRVLELQDHLWRMSLMEEYDSCIKARFIYEAPNSEVRYKSIAHYEIFDQNNILTSGADVVSYDGKYINVIKDVITNVVLAIAVYPDGHPLDLDGNFLFEIDLDVQRKSNSLPSVVRPVDVMMEEGEEIMSVRRCIVVNSL